MRFSFNQNVQTAPAELPTEPAQSCLILKGPYEQETAHVCKAVCALIAETAISQLLGLQFA